MSAASSRSRTRGVVVRAVISPPDAEGRCRVTEEFSSVDDYIERQASVLRHALAALAARALDDEARLLPPRPGPTKRRSRAQPPLNLSDDAYIDQRSGLVDQDLYLRLYRAGAFPAKRVGKRIVARWGDVRAVLAGDLRAAPIQGPQDALDDLRRELGLAQRGRE